MKKELVMEVCQKMEGSLNFAQLKQLEAVLGECLGQYRLEGQQGAAGVSRPLEMFIEAKRVEGCSDTTLEYYARGIAGMLEHIGKSVRDITTDDLRIYLGKYQSERGVSRVTIDNLRRIMSSFFGWLEDEDFIIKSPVRRIHKIKTGKTVKEAFSDENIEKMRGACEKQRDRAMLELLISTGIRVGELVQLNRQDVNLAERSCVVLGKGNAQREVYFDARAKIYIAKYLAERKDDQPALFVKQRSPHTRLTTGGVEGLVRRIGQKAGVAGAHPHKFRRTMATMAIDKGMPIEQVQQLLGHVRIDTTMHYAMVSQNNVRNSHRKYIG